jgi:hypothetical protein
MWFRMSLRIAQSIAEGVPNRGKAQKSDDFRLVQQPRTNIALAKEWDISP